MESGAPRKRYKSGGLYTSDGSVELDESSDSSDSESEEEQVDHREETQCNDGVVTETPTSISSLRNSEARQNELEEEFESLETYHPS